MENSPAIATLSLSTPPCPPCMVCLCCCTWWVEPELLVLAVEAGLPANPDVKLYGMLMEFGAVLIASRVDGVILVLKLGWKFDKDLISTRSTGTNFIY